ncbi:DedA family protein [Aurantimonas coralicida]|jgi:membrane protein DedA with SNARE-associated domain|uniref:DedA family protein n=1 Tax=Aurantimonas coralicida TaxID=182270 RepID=UPI001D18821D|nr:DedA family protein [Aurantimonas coralicida]MCC4300046.1 DedA family protein [Aurantimonas coralicida]MCD1645112.1 DedA family protein [Aurantimonas coralicida]MCW7546175.1 DedA family protein [Aurantimonas litoralis]
MFDWIVALVERTGSIGVALLMLAENVFPPVPSELIMPLAGFSAARGDLNIVAIIIAGTIGSLLGALLWYYIGKWIGAERLKRWASRHGRWLTITPEEVDQASNWFHRHGGMAVFIGRLIPAVRTLISVPAGVAGMPLTPFLLYTILGTVIWTAFLAGAGYFLESQYQRVSNWVNPVSNVVIGLFVLWYIYRVVTFRGRRT